MNASDLVAINSKRFSHRPEAQRAFGPRRDEGVEHTSILKFNDGHAEIGGHHRAWVHDIFQQVIQIIAASANQVRASLSSFAVKSKARGANCIENAAALTPIRPGERCGSKFSLPFANRLMFVGRGLSQFTPNFPELLCQVSIIETPNLTCM